MKTQDPDGSLIGEFIDSSADMSEQLSEEHACERPDFDLSPYDTPAHSLPVTFPKRQITEIISIESDFSLTSDMACPWEPNFRPHAHPQIFHNGVGYCSLSEASFSILLEYFIPGFDIVPGKTFQVAIGAGRSVDFCINGTLVEYHQLRLNPSRGKFGDFSSESEFREYRRILQRVRGSSRKRALLEKIVHQRLAGHYYRKRRAFVDRSPHFAHCDLVVATTREEFFDRVVRQFSILAVPSNSVLESMFWKGVKQVAENQECTPSRKDGLP